MQTEKIIQQLSLTPHPFEGGYYRRTYESGQSLETQKGQRKILTSIYYMLTEKSPVGFLHKNTSDIIHYYHAGGSIRYILVSPEGRMTESVMGNNIMNGEKLQLIVKGGYWKASCLVSGEYGLISEAVAPGFAYEDNEVATLDSIYALFPDLIKYLEKYIKR